MPHAFRFSSFLLAALLAAGCSSGESESQAGAQPAPKVGVVTLETRSVELLTELPGRTDAYRVAEVRPQVQGIIIERAFTEGASVEAGDLLYRIDPKPYRARYNQARAQLAQARATVSATARRAKRFKSLLDDNAVSAQEYDDVRSQLAQQRAAVNAAQAEVEAARVDLDYTSIAAPIDGQIGRSFVTEGALVSTNQAQMLAQVTQLDPVYVDISRSARALLELRRALAAGDLEQTDGGKAKVTLLMEDGREYEHTGTLEFTDVTVDPGTGSVVLRAVVPNPDHVLMPGMFVRARLSEGRKPDALLVPQQGVTRDRDGDAVAMVVGENSKAKRHKLKIDRAIGSYWLVTDGLSAGDRLIVTGTQGVQPDTKVRTEPADISNWPIDDVGEARQREPEAVRNNQAPGRGDRR